MVLLQNCAILYSECDNIADFDWGKWVLGRALFFSIDESIRILLMHLSHSPYHRHSDWHLNMTQNRSLVRTLSISERPEVRLRSIISVLSSVVSSLRSATQTFQRTPCVTVTTLELEFRTNCLNCDNTSSGHSNNSQWELRTRVQINFDWENVWILTLRK